MPDNIRMMTYRKLVGILTNMGYPREFADLVADNLRTEKAMGRMIGYLRQAKPAHPEEIADELFAIMQERDKWVEQKKLEYYNRKNNDMLNNGLGID